MTLKKITSPDCQSEGPSAPAPSPTSSFFGSPTRCPVDPPPEMDFDAVAKILSPIQEELNEAALEASYPSPPLNTPVVSSPANSIIYRYPKTRGRGYSLLCDGFHQTRLDTHSTHYREGDVGSKNCSPELSIVEDEGAEIASISEVLSDNHMYKNGPGSTTRSVSPISVTSRVVPFMLGPPAPNPLIEEYLAFTSDDLPTNSVAPCIPSTLMETGAASIKPAINSSSEHNSFSEGVTEKTTWAEEVEEAFERVCLRLEQLALDEFNLDPSKNIEKYYLDRLERLLSSDKRALPVRVRKASTTHK